MNGKLIGTSRKAMPDSEVYSLEWSEKNEISRRVLIAGVYCYLMPIDTAYFFYFFIDRIISSASASRSKIEIFSKKSENFVFFQKNKIISTVAPMHLIRDQIH